MTGVQTCALPICFPVTIDGVDATLIVKDSADPSKGVLFGTTAYTSNDSLEKANVSQSRYEGFNSSRSSW